MHSRSKTLLGLQKIFNDKMRISDKNNISNFPSIIKRTNKSLNMPKSKKKY
jgi:hypothetical protein